MKTVLYIVGLYWKLATALVAGCLGGFFLAPKAYSDVTQELIALFGLMIAGVLPTMVLTASVLRAGSLSASRLKNYAAALTIQLQIWVGLFLVAFAASVIVIIGKMSNWALIVPLCPVAICNSAPHLSLNGLVNGAITGSAVLLALRVKAVGDGIFSLLRLSSEIALSEASERDSAQRARIKAAVEAMVDPANHGQFVDLPN